MLRARAFVENASAELVGARSRRADADLLRAEMRWAADAMQLGADLGIARLDAGAGVPLGALPLATRQALAERFESLAHEQRTLWLRRDRPGGLDESLVWLERVRAALTKP